MNQHILARTTEAEASPFDRLRNLVGGSTRAERRMEEARNLIDSAIEGAPFYESALGYGQEFEARLEQMLRLQVECHKYLEFFEDACGRNV
jgi:hypothetical protein